MPQSGPQTTKPAQDQIELGVGPLSRHVAQSTRKLLRSFRENVELGTLLAFIAGIVNTVAFLQFGTFVSHISGHATRAAVEYTEANPDAAYVFFLEMIFFILGAFSTSFLLRGHTAAYARVKYTAPVMIEALLITLFLGLIHFSGRLWFHLGNTSLTTVLLALAMGMQNAMLRQTSGAIIRTTHMTGVATDIGIELGAAVSTSLQQWTKSKGFKLVRFVGVWRSFWQRLGVGRFTFQIMLFTSFFSGSIIGTIGFMHFTVYVLIVPIIVLFLIGLREYKRVTPKSK